MEQQQQPQQAPMQDESSESLGYQEKPSDPENSPRPFTTRQELTSAYIRVARQHADRSAIRGFSSLASCQQIGAVYGVGVGLYFKVLVWMKALFFLLTLTAIPYFIVVNTSVFTDEPHKNDHKFGIKVYDPPEIFSFTLAAIVDPAIDNSTLQYMNTDIGGTWRGPMRKGTFLTWISLVDAGGIVLALGLITFFMLQANKFIQKVDVKTTEAADYTVLVQGLPTDTDVHELGEHFSRFGEVMDVVLVRDMRGILQSCARASALEARRKLTADQAKLYGGSGPHLALAEMIEEKLAKVLTRIEARAGGPEDFPVKAAFVTFNFEAQKGAVLANCPRSWLASLFTPRCDRMRGYALRVASAYPAEEYIHENVACPRWVRWGRMLLTRAAVLAMLLLCAAIITGLSTVSIQQDSVIAWRSDDMTADIGAAGTRLVTPAPDAVTASTTASLMSHYSAAVAAAMTKLRVGGAALPAVVSGADPSIAAAADWSLYCSSALPHVCAPYFGASVGVSPGSLNMAWGAQMAWANQTDMLIRQRPLLKALAACATGTDTSGTCDAVAATLAPAACLPCMCLGLSLDPTAHTDAWVTAARSECSPYINGWDLQSRGVQVSVSIVIAALNAALKLVLQSLVALERHWTKTQQERSYAVLAFSAQLLNSALVLLLVNAAPAADAARDGAKRVGALHKFVLSGQYSDFSPGWYEQVGLSILVLLMISALSPAITVAADWGWKAVQRCRVVRFSRNAAQDQFDVAFSRPEFNLQQRVADAMLVVAVTFMFGSGMPLAYVLAFIVFLITSGVERYALTHVCAVTTRYSKQLPALLLELLPYAAIAHCAFGVWMHTYFKVEGSDIMGSQLASLSSSLTATLTRGGSSNGNATLVVNGTLNSNGTAAGSDSNSGVLGVLGAASLGVITSTVDSLRNTALVSRITQPNGIALLVCVVLLLAWMLMRHVLWRLFRGCLRGALRWLLRCRCCYPLLFPAEPSPVRYEDALSGNALIGSPTYRLPHHPRYAATFSGRLHKAIWLRALGTQRFTRVVSLRGAEGMSSFAVAPAIIRATDTSELEAELGSSRLPSKVTEVAQRLASQTPSNRSVKTGKGRGRQGSRYAPGSGAGGRASPAGSTDGSPRTVHIHVLADNPAAIPLHMLMTGGSSGGGGAGFSTSSSRSNSTLGVARSAREGAALTPPTAAAVGRPPRGPSTGQAQAPGIPHSRSNLGPSPPASLNGGSRLSNGSMGSSGQASTSIPASPRTSIGSDGSGESVGTAAEHVHVDIRTQSVDVLEVAGDAAHAPTAAAVAGVQYPAVLPASEAMLAPVFSPRNPVVADTAGTASSPRFPIIFPQANTSLTASPRPVGGSQ